MMILSDDTSGADREQTMTPPRDTDFADRAAHEMASYLHVYWGRALERGAVVTLAAIIRRHAVAPLGDPTAPMLQNHPDDDGGPEPIL